MAIKMFVLLCSFVPCAAVDYRAGCFFNSRANSFSDKKCGEKMDSKIEDGDTFSITVDEGNDALWTKIFDLCNEHHYEFGKSWKSVKAVSRIVHRMATGAREGAQIGSRLGGELGFATCFIAKMLDNPKCGADTLCHTFESLKDGLECSAAGAFGGGVVGAIGGAGYGLVNGVVEVYNDNGQLRVEFKPVGRWDL